MKVKFFIIAIAFLGMMSSCKDDKKTEGAESTEAKAPGKQNFVVEMDVTTQTKDDFTVYYTEDGTNMFQPTQTVWRGVAGGGAKEKIVFDLPDEIVPTNIRLDFGMNKDRQDLTVDNIKFSYLDKSFQIKGSDFFNYFIKEERTVTEVNAQNGTIKLGKTTGNDGTFFYPRQELLDEIAKMTK